jgi:hypothetical protein
MDREPGFPGLLSELECHFAIVTTSLLLSRRQLQSPTSVHWSRSATRISTTASGQRQIDIEPTSGLRCKSTVYGLNGHRAIFVIDLSVGTCEHVI